MSVPETGDVIVVIPEGHERIPFACPVCDFVLRTREDVAAWRDTRCCEECHLRWAQSRRSAWSDGWRPSFDEVKAEVAVRRTRMARILT